MMVGVMHPATIGVDEDNAGRKWANHGKGAQGGSVGSEDKVTVSISASFPITSRGEVLMSPVSSSKMMEMSVRREGVSLSPSAVCKID
jgi:hypothetical protein